MPFKSPERRREWQRERMRKVRAGKTAAKSCATRPVRLDTADAVRAMLEATVNELLASDVEIATRARILCRAGEVILKALDMSELERRLTALEVAINANTSTLTS